MNPPRNLQPGMIVVRTRRDGLSFRFDRRSLIVCLVMSLLSLALVAMSLMSGDYGIPLNDVARILAGQGDEMARMIVLEWRLPRALLAVVLGAALGMSGAIFQSLTRNPLGSPDIIGLSVGAHTGALFTILVISSGYYQTASGALIGSIATAAVIYLLTYRRGVEGFRLIVIGVAIAAMLSAANAWMIRKAELEVAMSAATWAAGSLNGLGMDRLVPAGIGLLLLMLPIFALSRPMRQLEMGDDAAIASGLSPDRIRLALAVLGVALVALTVAAAGPIAFIALAAPHLARRLTGSAGISLVPSALMGGLLLIVADWSAQHAFGLQLPVGVMTFNIGGLYFLWLLVSEGRR